MNPITYTQQLLEHEISHNLKDCHLPLRPLGACILVVFAVKSFLMSLPSNLLPENIMVTNSTAYFTQITEKL